MSGKQPSPAWSDLFRPGENCWRVERARRAAVVLETADYFAALREACAKARNHVFILGWDFDRLERVGRGDDAPTFEDFFTGLLNDKPGLEIYLLTWDYHLVYAAEREWLQGFKLRHNTHERLHVHYDGAHPPGGSQHQKIVVVDDAVAFSGGIDLSRWRWDTAEHRPDDERRTDPDGDAYPPFHDAMMLVDAAAAAALGEIARERWRRSGASREAPPPADDGADPWPESVEARFRDTDIAIARTLPAFEGREAVREVERLFLDSIAAARNYLYVENQYFTSGRLTAALAERLSGDDPPAVVLVLPHHTGGWLEQHTMDVLRRRRVQALVDADRHGRLRVLYPHQPGLGENECISVHAKLCVFDDRFVRVGSANTSDRSMGLDSECDLALDAPGEDGARAVLHRLLGEHLDCEPEAVAAARERSGGLLAAIDSLRRPEGRSLRLLDVSAASPALDLGGEADLVDPSEPLDVPHVIGRAVPAEEKAQSHKRLWAFLAFIAALLALAASWRWTPLGDWLSGERVADLLAWFDDPVVRLLAVFGAVVVASLLMVPLSALVVACALLLGAWTGFACSMAAALLSALLAFAAGQAMAGRIIERYEGTRIYRLSQRLSDRGVMTVAALRLLPVAPYTVVNLVAGASHLQLGKFMVGTVLGLLPGVGALTLFSGTLYEALTDPSAETIAWLAVVAVAIGVGVWVLRRLLKRS